MPNNFLATLPKRVQALKAIEMFKDEYLLDYMNVEELGVRDAADMDERVVENAIVQNVKNFIMIGGTEAQLQLASTVSFTIRRLVARIKVNSIKTAFAGGPYEGMPLTDLKAYLINVQASKFIYNGAGDNFSILNNGKYIEEDSRGCAMQGLIADVISAPVYDDGYSVPHYFYCYENALESETGGNKFTRIVLEGKLDGTTYYYPIPIKGISRNSCYSIDVTIKRPGSLDPNKDVEKGTLLATMTVLDWDVIDNNNVEF
jgi:hypothetical protein